MPDLSFLSIGSSYSQSLRIFWFVLLFGLHGHGPLSNTGPRYLQLGLSQICGVSKGGRLSPRIPVPIVHRSQDTEPEHLSIRRRNGRTAIAAHPIEFHSCLFIHMLCANHREAAQTIVDERVFVRAHSSLHVSRFAAHTEARACRSIAQGGVIRASAHTWVCVVQPKRFHLRNMPEQ